MEPKLRFSEFNSNWTHDNLENVAEIFDGTHQTPLYTKTGVQFVSVENIEDIYKSEKYISHEEYDKYKNKPQINDILMTRITAGVIGETAMVTKDVPLAYYVSLALIRCEKLFPSYVEKYIHSIQFRKELYKRIIHTAFPKKINLGDIGKCLVGITNEQEQQKIAEFLSTIDIVITKQKETVSAWEERKKGVMQKLFSQEVRFKADDGSDFPEWEEKKIDDLFYKVNERNNGQFGKDKWISVAKMYYQDEDKVTSNNIDNRTYVMRVGDMSFEGHPNKEFKYGRFVVNDIGDGIISELFPIYRHKENYILKYWKYAIQVDSIMQKIYRKSITSSGSSSNKLDDDDFKRQSILVPCLAEQQKIADCLSSLDEVIETQKATLAAWEELKKGLLQQMFV